MRKFFLLACIYLLIHGFTDITLFAQDATITIGSTQQCTTGQILIPVRISQLNNVYSVTLRIIFVNSHLTYGGIQNLNTKLAGANIANPPAFPQQINLAWSNLNPVGFTNNELLFNISFNTTSGSSNVVWDQDGCEISNDAVPYSLGFVNGSVQILNIPAAAGDITGSNDVCPGQSGVAYTVAELAYATSYIWQYSGAGVTINNSSSNNVTIDFAPNATSGNLTVRGSNFCGAGSASPVFAIAILSAPGAAGSISGSSTVCQGQSGVAYSVALITGATSYSWIYSGTGATINNSTSNAITIDYSTNATAGNLTVIGVNSCGNGTPSSNYAIEVNPLPGTPGSISGSSNVCAGQNSVNYSAPVVQNATSYTWTYTGSGINIINGNTNSITINFSSNATSGNLTVKGINACGEGQNSDGFAITVNPLPGTPGSISGSSTVCQGQNAVAFSIPAISHATSYSWSYTGVGATINNANSNSITIHFSSNSTSGNLTVKGVNNCGNGLVSQDFSITINPLPGVPGPISGSSVVCQGQNGVSFSASAANFATGYNWSYTGTGITIINGTSNAITINFANNATSGNLSVLGFNACGNGTSTANFAITVNPLPGTPGSIAGSSNICPGQNSVNYSVLVVPNAISYSWNYTGTGITISNGSTNSITINFSSNATSGNLTVKGINACGDGQSSASFPITVNPLPGTPGSISGSSTVCQGQNAVAFSVSSILHATSYSWTYTGMGATINNGTSNNISINFSGEATSGNLTVKGVNACGDGPSSLTFPILVNPLPGTAGTISGSSVVCQGQNGVSFSVSEINNATGYNWSYSGIGATIANGGSNNITISFSANATSGNLMVRGVNSCGNGPFSNGFPISVSPLPGTPSTITGSSVVCQGQSTVSYSVPSIANATGYIWTYSGTGATFINGNTNNIAINFSSDATAGNLSVKGVNACGEGPASTNFSIFMNLLPGTPEAITGTSAVCQGQSNVSYSVSAIASATGYSWSYSGTGATISFGSTNNILVSFALNATSGNLTVRGTNSCGNGPFSEPYIITVTSLPGAPASISGPASVCKGQTGVSFSVPEIAFASSYIWTYTGTGATIYNGNTNAIIIDFASNATSGNLNVRGTNACGNGPVSANFAITTTSIPGTPGSINGTANICQGVSSISYSVAAIANATGYIWSYSGSGITINNGNTNNITIDFSTNATAGNLTVRGTNACGNGPVSANYSINVNPIPGTPGMISGTSTVCQSQTGVSYAVPAIPNVFGYIWTYTGTGATINNGNTNNIIISFSSSATSGELTVKGINNCGVGPVSADFVITVNPLPATAGPISGTNVVCQGQNSVMYSIQEIAHATGYTWIYTGSGISVNNGNTNSITIDFSSNATSGNLTVRGTNACGNGPVSTQYSITVNPLPRTPSSIIGPAEVCLGQAGVGYAVPIITYSTSYEWFYTGTGITVNNGNTQNITIDFASNATSGELTVRGTNACGNGVLSTPLPITIITTPDAAGTISGPSQVNAGTNDVVFEIVPVFGAIWYQWVFTGEGATIVGNTHIVTISFSPTATNGILSVSAFNDCGNGPVSPGHSIQIITAGTKSLNLTCLLEGPFNGVSLNTDLLNNDHLPLSQPYHISPWLYNGNESVIAIPAGVVDWVLLELRDAGSAASATSDTRVLQKAAFLKYDGSIVEMDGVSLVGIGSPVINQQLFIVVQHRNHLDIMSSGALAEVNNVFTWDFTSAQSKAYNNGQKPLQDNLFGMYGGDGDGNGQIQNQDKNAIWNPQSGQSGYKAGDYDMNGQVQNQDKNNVWNPNSGKGSAVP